jgi:hypothetical protein
MSERTPLISSTAVGRTRRLRGYSTITVIGMLLMIAGIAFIASIRSPVTLESDGEHDSTSNQLDPLVFCF